MSQVHIATPVHEDNKTGQILPVSASSGSYTPLLLGVLDGPMVGTVG